MKDPVHGSWIAGEGDGGGNGDGSWVLCGKAKKAQVQTGGWGPERSTTTHSGQTCLAAASHWRGDSAMSFCSAGLQRRPEQESHPKARETISSQKENLVSYCIFFSPRAWVRQESNTLRSDLSQRGESSVQVQFNRLKAHTTQMGNKPEHPQQQKECLILTHCVEPRNSLLHFGSYSPPSKPSYVLSGWLAQRIIRYSGNSHLLHLLPFIIFSTICRSWIQSSLFSFFYLQKNMQAILRAKMFQNLSQICYPSFSMITLITSLE